MKKWAIWLVALVMLTGCSGKNKALERGLSLRTRLLQGESCTFSLEITADNGEQICTFCMDCQADSKGNVSFTVTAPESIAGIGGSLSSEGGKLTFGDTVLDLGTLAQGRITPISAPWLLIKTLRGGCITAAGEEGGLLRLSVDDSYADDSLQLEIWCDDADLPVKAEVVWEDRRILSLVIQNFTIA